MAESKASKVCKRYRYPRAMATAPSLGQKLRQLWNHPAGPKTIHFWAPTFKWGISFANIAGAEGWELQRLHCGHAPADAVSSTRS